MVTHPPEAAGSCLDKGKGELRFPMASVIQGRNVLKELIDNVSGDSALPFRISIGAAISE